MKHKKPQSETTEVKTFSLSNRGLKNIAARIGPYDFKFIVSGEVYKCHKFFADFISPKVSLIHLTDPLCDKYKIDIEDPNKSFKLIVKIMYGEDITPNDEEKEFIKNVACLLGNAELFERYTPKITNLDSDNYYDLFEIFEKKYEYNMDFSNEIRLFASQFYDLPHQDFIHLPLYVVRKITSSPYIFLDREDQLLNFVLMLIRQNGSSYIELLHDVYFENLTSKSVAELFTVLKAEWVDKKIFDRLLSRFFSELGHRRPNFSRYFSETHKADFPNTGILEIIRSLPGGITKYINVVADQNSAPKIIGFLLQESVPLEVTVKEFFIEFVNSYVLLTNYVAVLSNHPDIYWTVEYSIDGSKYMKLDKRKSLTDQNITYASKTPKCFKFLKLSIQFVTSSHSNNVKIRQFEMYGEFKILSE